MKNKLKFWWPFRGQRPGLSDHDRPAYTPMENATRTLLWDRIQERTWSQFRDSLRMYLWSQFRTRSSGQPWVLRDLLTDQLEEDWGRNRPV